MSITELLCFFQQSQFTGATDFMQLCQFFKNVSMNIELQITIAFIIHFRKSNLKILKNPKRILVISKPKSALS